MNFDNPLKFYAGDMNHAGIVHSFGMSDSCCPKACRPPIDPAPGLMFRFLKTDSATAEGIAGAVFALSDGTNTRQAASDAKGFVKFPVQPDITYTLSEVTPPPGYAPSAETWQIRITCDGRLLINGVPARNLLVPNAPTGVRGSFTAYKTNAADSAVRLAGACFTLFRGKTALQTVTTGSDGGLTFSDLPPGTYELAELQTPAGYQPPGSRYTVTVTEEGEVLIGSAAADGFEIPNLRAFNAVIDAVDEAGEPVQGASFTLTQNGQTVVSAVTDEKGIADLGYVAPGEYTLTLVSPPGYLPVSQTFEVCVDQNGIVKINCLPAALFTVKLNGYTDISFQKTDENGAPLSGAEFSLASNKTELATAASDENGKVTFESIAPGVYTLTETAAPSGYASDTAVHTVVVTEQGGVTIDGKPAQQFSIKNAASTEQTTINYLANGGEGEMSDTTAARAPYTVKTAAQTAITRDGYTFTGWNTAADGSGTAYAPGDTITPEDGVTLYAQWHENFAVTYNSNAAAAQTYKDELDYGSIYTIKTPADAGFTSESELDSWNTAADGSGTAYAPGSVYKDDANLTLYAIWKAQ